MIFKERPTQEEEMAEQLAPMDDGVYRRDLPLREQRQALALAREMRRQSDNADEILSWLYNDGIRDDIAQWAVGEVCP